MHLSRLELGIHHDHGDPDGLRTTYGKYDRSMSMDTYPRPLRSAPALGTMAAFTWGGLYTFIEVGCRKPRCMAVDPSFARHGAPCTIALPVCRP